VKVLLLTDGITPFVIGGMQKHSFMLAKYLARAGVQIELHHCIYFNEKLPNAKSAFTPEENKNIKAFAYRFPEKGLIPGHYVRNSYKYSVTIFNEVKNRLNEFDFIYTKGFTGWKLLEEKQKGLKMPKVGVKFHGYEMFQPPADFKSKLQFKLLQKPTLKLNQWADVVFSYGGKITTIIESLGVKKANIIEIPSGIEESFIRNQAEIKASLPINLCFIGRYERRKGIKELTTALQNLIKEKLDFKFHFIGSIPNDKKINDDRIVYHGQLFEVEKKKQILDRCDVLVCPSYSEGMPNVILEGMARGLAVIATDVGANQLFFEKNVGLLITPGKTDALYEALFKLICVDNQTINKLKQESNRLVSNKFKWQQIAEKVMVELKR